MSFLSQETNKASDWSNQSWGNTKNYASNNLGGNQFNAPGGGGFMGMGNLPWHQQTDRLKDYWNHITGNDPWNFGREGLVGAAMAQGGYEAEGALGAVGYGAAGLESYKNWVKHDQFMKQLAKYRMLQARNYYASNAGANGIQGSVVSGGASQNAAGAAAPVIAARQQAAMAYQQDFADQIQSWLSMAGYGSQNSSLLPFLMG